jgi:hypothetical protein
VKTIVPRAVYGVFGVLGIGLGILVLIRPSLALPPDGVSTLTAHLVREEASEAIFIGLMFLWCLVHFDQSRPVHFALLVFTALFAAIHWGEYFEGRRQISSPIVNSIPLLLLLVISPAVPRATAIRLGETVR